MKSFVVGLGMVAVLPAHALLSGCTAAQQDRTAVSVPENMPAQAVRVGVARLPPGGEAASFHRLRAPRTAKHGIYVSSFDGSSIYGFKSDYRTGYGPICTIYTGQVYINDIAVDPQGNLVAPYGSPNKVVVYKGPGMCGAQLGEIGDPYGQPVAAASLNAATGTIVLADFSTSPTNPAGNVAICTLQSGCTSMLSNSNITGNAAGVAMAKNGDCWLVSENKAKTAANLTYWAGCTGSGEAATGFKNGSYGSLGIDTHGNLVSVDYGGFSKSSGDLWVYSGCNPGCKVVGGPFALVNNPLFGALNSRGNTFGDMELDFPYGGAVDIYSYTPTKLTYQYSFDSSFAPVAGPEGFAYNPPSE